MTGEGPLALLAALSLLAAPGAQAAAPGGRARVIVRIAGPSGGSRAAGDASASARRRSQAAALRAREAELRRTFEPALEAWRAAGRVSGVRWLPVLHAFSVEADAEVVRALAADPAVRSVRADALELVPLADAVEPNVEAVGAAALWALGATGDGAVVAVLDTGVDVAHPDLAPRFRAGPGGWFDPYGAHPEPTDPSGHGTWVAGVIVGGGAGGTAIGVAPGARFIAAKVFPDSGPASATAVHLAFAWVLDPDGDPGTDDAPRIVNASWGLAAPGCDEEFREDVQALRVAGILPVFAAGNQGPGEATGVSPANYPEALSVGAVDLAGLPEPRSSRGPSACGGGPFPTLAGPGVDVLTSDLLGGHLHVSGTSVAAPHVSGVAALLASAFPEATADALQEALVGGATDLGLPGCDSATGWGLVDGREALEVLGEGGPPAENVPPVAVNDRVRARRWWGPTILDVTSNDLDVDGRVVPGSLELVEAPRRGWAWVAGGRVHYWARGPWRRPDRFSYRVRDDRGARSNTAIVRVGWP